MNSENKELRKEGHLYLVTEDRNGKVYLWDFTEKDETEFVEENLPEDVLKFATEGAMLQFKEGQYILYSPYGYDIVDEENDEECNKCEDKTIKEEHSEENNEYAHKINNESEDIKIDANQYDENIKNEDE